MKHGDEWSGRYRPEHDVQLLTWFRWIRARTLRRDLHEVHQEKHARASQFCLEGGHVLKDSENMACRKGMKVFEDAEGLIV